MDNPAITQLAQAFILLISADVSLYLPVKLSRLSFKNSQFAKESPLLIV